MSPSEQVRGDRDNIQHPGENLNRWRTLFMRMQKRGALQSSRAALLSPDQGSHLYGRSLLSICDEDKRLPKPIREVLTELWRRAPDTEGVFRKAGNAKRLSEVRVQLDAGEDLDMEALPVILLAALLKDFLRQLPDGLLGAPLYPAWMSAMEKEEEQRCAELKLVSNRLPKANIHLLQCLLLVLHHISQSADLNKMDARNLAVCISPNLLPLEHLSLDKVEKVTALTQFLIENCGEIFKNSVQPVVGGPAEDQLADSTDSLWSHGQDSAYESGDPEAEVDPAGDEAAQEVDPAGDKVAQEVDPAGDEAVQEVDPAGNEPVQEVMALPPHQPFGSIPRRPSRPMGRRRSEPAILRSAGMRALLKLSRAEGGPGDDRPLRKQNSHDSFLLHSHGLTTAPPPRPANADPSPCANSSPPRRSSPFSNSSPLSVSGNYLCLGSSPSSNSSPLSGNYLCSGSSPWSNHSPLPESSHCDSSDRVVVLSGSGFSRPRGHIPPTPGVKRRSWSMRKEGRRTTPSLRSSQ